MVCFKDILSKVSRGGGVQYFPGVQLLQWGSNCKLYGHLLSLQLSVCVCVGGGGGFRTPCHPL